MTADESVLLNLLVVVVTIREAKVSEQPCRMPYKLLMSQQRRAHVAGILVPWSRPFWLSSEKPLADNSRRLLCSCLLVRTIHRLLFPSPLSN
jgi:hypothetical protein